MDCTGTAATSSSFCIGKIFFCFIRSLQYDTRQKITGEITSWASVTTAPHRFGGTEFRYNNKRELGHLHGNSLLDIPFPMDVRNELVNSGREQPHHILPESGWISFFIRTDNDVNDAIALMKLSYEIAAHRYGKEQQ